MHEKLITRIRTLLVAILAFCVLGVPAARAQEEAAENVESVGSIDLIVEPGNAQWAVDPAVDVGVNWLSAHQENFWLGVQVDPADAALRAQLAIEEGQGLIVSAVEPGSPAEEAGLQPHDVLLSIAGRPLPDAATLDLQIKAAGNTTAPIVFLRGGKRLTVDVTPRQRNWFMSLSSIVLNANQFRIGVGVVPADETLRAQLGLADDAGLVVTGVEEECPAAAAGIQLHDILLEFGGKQLTTVEDLTSQVQEVGEKPATLRVLRGGEESTLQVTPKKQDHLSEFIVTLNDPPHVGSITTFQLAGEALIDPSESGLTGAIDLDLTNDGETEDDPLRELIEQVKQLNQRIDVLEKSVRQSQSDEPHDR